MKRTTNPEKFPEEQHATSDEERFVESLSTLLTEELERLSSQNSIFHAGGLPVLSYGAWKRCRTLVGSRCLALRQLTGTPPSPSCGVAQRAAVASTAAANITST
jgi:hypothetical protein